MSLFGAKEKSGTHPECAGLVQHCGDESAYDYDADIVEEWQQRAESGTPNGPLEPSSGKPLANNMSYTL